MTGIGLLQLGHVPRPSQGIEGDYPELFTDLLAPHGIEVTPFDCAHGQLPQALGDFDGWICSPSRASTYDDLDWLPAVEELIRSIVAEERAFVGICFGHQLTAQALGGRVERSPRGWGVGAHTYDITRRPAGVDEGHNTVTLVASHQDQVVVVPDGAEVWAGNAHCPNGGLIVNERAWTIQTHPEFSAPVAAHILSGRVEILGRETVAAAQASLDATPLDRELVATWIARTVTL